MTVRGRAVAGVVLAVALAAAPAHGRQIRPLFATSTVYFQCGGATKVHQANYAVGLTGSDYMSGWHQARPAQRLSEGAGCAAGDWGGTANNVYRPVFRGWVIGNLRDLTVRVHRVLLGAVADDQAQTLRLFGDVDGTPIFPPGPDPDDGRTVTVTPVPAADGAADMFEFTITNLGFAEEVRDEDGDVVAVETGGLATEDGVGTGRRVLTLGLGVHGTALGQDPAGHRAGAWAWGAADVAGGITFNPEAPAGAVVAADLPG